MPAERPTAEIRKPPAVAARQGFTGHAAWLILLALFVAFFSAGLLAISQNGHPLSVIDEHIHFNTAVLAGSGEIPFRG